jgi:diadenosine tetraphosphate (Ap4A) HIT family hydrolase
LNETIRKFGYPATRMAEYEHWVVLFREKQVTAGCLILACKEEAGALSAISAAAFTELAHATAEIETSLRAIVGYDRINYLLLMMVDPHVHFHVIPRHAEERTIAGVTFRDAAWPKPPDLSAAHSLTDDESGRVRAAIAAAWRSGT